MLLTAMRRRRVFECALSGTLFLNSPTSVPYFTRIFGVDTGFGLILEWVQDVDHAWG